MDPIGRHWKASLVCAMLGEQPLDGVSGPEGFVSCTTLWWVDGPEYLGRIGNPTPAHSKPTRGGWAHRLRRAADGPSQRPRHRDAAGGVAGGVGVGHRLGLVDLRR